MNIFDFSDSRKFLKKRLRAFPHQGRGQAKKLAEHLSVSTAFVSQVLAEQRYLTADQAFLAAEYLEFSEIERSYFLKLVQMERAGHHRHKALLQKELAKLKVESKVISRRIEYKKTLSSEERGIFYSDWYYSAIRMQCSIRPRGLDSLKRLLGLPSKVVSEAVEFLVKSGLIVEEKNKYRIGDISTHIDADSPLVYLHHSNWRRQALEHVKLPGPIKLHYTSPMTLSVADAEVVQGLLLKAISDIGRIVDPSPAEKMMCLNIDWFGPGKGDSEETSR